MKPMNGLKTILGVIMLAVVLAACGGKTYEPQAINEATDVCAICKMAIKDDQFATQIITKDGQSLKFDDLGCLNEWKTKNGTDTIGAAFVRDYNSKQWIRYEKASYVYDASLKTPMAYGVVSFEKKEDAQAFIAKEGKGTLMTAESLANHTWEVNRDMMQGHGHSQGHDDGKANGHEADGHQDAAPAAVNQDGHGAAEQGTDHAAGGHAK